MLDEERSTTSTEVCKKDMANLTSAVDYMYNYYIISVEN